MSDIVEVYGTKIRLPEQPNQEEILNYGLPIKQQKWVKKELPQYFDRVEYNKNGDLILTYEQELYARQEVENCKKGIWIYIKGIPRYITGKYYFFLQYYILEDGNNPDFREADRLFFLFLDYWYKIEWCLGYIRTKKRRDGASSHSCSNMLYEAIFYKNSNCGLVSKTKEDSKETFTQMITSAYRQLPVFLKPKQVNKEDSVTELVFSHKAQSLKDGVTVAINDIGGNNSRISYKAPAINAYDRSRMSIVLIDEGGKYPKEVPTSQLLAVISKTLVRGVKRVGWVEMPSTTNEMTKGGGLEFFKVWKYADQFKQKPTINRLVRYFRPAYEAYEGFIDEYGDSVIDEPTQEQYDYLVSKWVKKDEDGNTISELTEEHIKNGAKKYITIVRRQGKEGIDLEEECRMHPANEDEAFLSAVEGCSFNSLVIKEQQKHLENNQPLLRTVTFYRNLEQKIEVREDEKGFWKILAFPTESEKNKFEFKDKLQQPLNIDKYCIGIDGVSATQNSNYGKVFGSKVGGFIIDRRTLQFIGMFYGRPETKEKYHEQILMAAEYYGCKIWIEKVADSYDDYFRERGKRGYLGKYPLSVIPVEKRYDNPERLYGFPITPFAMTCQLDKMVAYIEPDKETKHTYCSTIVFNELLEQLLLFDNNDRTKSDLVIAAMIALCCALEPINTPNKVLVPLVRTYS
jgi:hypothetical protein